MKIRFTSLSKTPYRSAVSMLDNGFRFLNHEFDSGECRDWELEDEAGAVTLTTFYEGTIEEDSLPKAIAGDLAEFYKKQGYKFKQETL